MSNEENFGVWLLMQRHRNDLVGDLARDFANAGGPGHTPAEVRKHMTLSSASCYALNALDVALEEWNSL